MTLREAFEKSLGHGHYIDRAFLESVGVHLEEGDFIFEMVRNKYKEFSPANFLLAMNFLKEYRFEMISALQFNIRSTSTYEDYLWSTLEQIDKSLPEV